MGKEIIYSFKEYQKNYTSILSNYFLEYEEAEETDFINNEIENYIICLRLVNFPIDKIFNRFWRVEYGINIKSFTISQEAYDFIFADENDEYYYKIYNDIVETSLSPESKIEIEKKIKQARLIFAKIISFLETKKLEPKTSQEYVNINNEVNAHPKFNPNLWNKDCFGLFKYLYENYYNSTNRQLINIWFYLKENGIEKYNLKATKDEYKGFILEYYSVKITNDEKAKFKYKDKEFQTLQDHRINFEDNLK